MDNAVATKDHLLGLINGAETNDQLFDVCDTIKVVLTHTEGLWQQLRYCYKAAEIAHRCVCELNHRQYGDEFQPVHHATADKLAKYALEMARLEDRYFQLQQEQWHAGLNSLEKLTGIEMPCLHMSKEELSA